MRSRNYVISAAIFAAGAVIGRIIGLKNLVKGATAAAAFTGIGPKKIVETADGLLNGRRSASRRTVRRPRATVTRKRSGKKSRAA